MQEALIPCCTEKKSLFGFSIYSISVRSVTASIKASGSRITAYSLLSSVTSISGYISSNFLRLPVYFTMTSHVSVSSWYPTFKFKDCCLSSSVASSARFSKFSRFELFIPSPGNFFYYYSIAIRYFYALLFSLLCQYCFLLCCFLLCCFLLRCLLLSRYGSVILHRYAKGNAVDIVIQLLLF